MYFTINGKDFSHLVSAMKVGFEVLVSNDSGRNANGDTVIDIINRKRKVYITLRHTTDDEMESFLSAVEGFVVSIQYRDPKTNELSSLSAYIGTPEPDYYTIQAGKVIYKPLALNFIEL